MGFIKFENSIYIAKNKVESDILFKNLNHGVLYVCDNENKRDSIFSHLSDEEFMALDKAKSRQVFGSQLRAEEAMYRSVFPEIRKEIENGANN